MSDENQEVLEDETDQLDEFKASHGDSSEVPEPVAKKAKPLPGSKSQGDKAPNTKMGMLNAMMKHYGEMKKTDLAAAYNKMREMYEDMEVSDEGTDEISESPRVTKDDIDLSDDVAALLGDEDLSEEFKEKATIIFESTVISKINEVLEDYTKTLSNAKDQEVNEDREELEEKLNDYLDYACNNYMTENHLAIEQGIRTEIAEEFMGGLKALFLESHIQMPDEKIDVLEELTDELDSLKEQLNGEVQKNIDLNKLNENLRKDSIIKSVSEGLTLAQTEKLESLAESVEFISEEDYIEKVDMLKETYFVEIEEGKETQGLFDDDEPLEEEVKTKSNPDMAPYVEHLRRTMVGNKK